MADTPEDETPTPSQAENDAAALAARGLAPAKKGKDDTDDDSEDNGEPSRKAKAASVEGVNRAVSTGGDNPPMKNR